jgi:hypothetical protein
LQVIAPLDHPLGVSNELVGEGGDVALDGSAVEEA